MVSVALPGMWGAKVPVSLNGNHFVASDNASSGGKLKNERRDSKHIETWIIYIGSNDNGTGVTINPTVTLNIYSVKFLGNLLEGRSRVR